MSFARIIDISSLRRLPRVGKIHLGVKQVSQKSGKEYPEEVDYFVFEAASPFYGRIVELYGKTPKELPVVFPCEDVEIFFPQALKYYGKGKGLICTGDGARARRLVGVPLGADSTQIKELPGGIVDIPCSYKGCPDYKRLACRRMGNLMVILPEITLAGVWQIDTGSFHSIVDLNSSIDHIERVTRGRISMLYDPSSLRPFVTLIRHPRETHEGGHKRIHYPMIARLNADLATIVEAGRNLGPVSRVVLPKPSVEEDLIPASVAGSAQRGSVEPGRGEIVQHPAAHPRDSASPPALRSGDDDGNPHEISASPSVEEAQALPAAAGMGMPTRASQSNSGIPSVPAGVPAAAPAKPVMDGRPQSQSLPPAGSGRKVLNLF